MGRTSDWFDITTMKFSILKGVISIDFKLKSFSYQNCLHATDIVSFNS